jgi:hypothetical protein
MEVLMDLSLINRYEIGRENMNMGYSSNISNVFMRKINTRSVIKRWRRGRAGIVLLIFLKTMTMIINEREIHRSSSKGTMWQQ